MQLARFPHHALRRVALCAAAALCGCLMGPGERQSRGSVIENELVGLLYAGDVPAAGARVRLFAGNLRLTDSLRLPVAEASADSLGRYRLSGIVAGVYSLLAQYDSLTYFRDSVVVSDPPKNPADVHIPQPDTLLRSGTVKAEIRLNPPDPSALIVAEILGTDLAARADSAGNVVLGGVPSGPVRIRIRSQGGNYQTLILPVAIKPGATASLGIQMLQPVSSDSGN